jgi:hypothetical protein
MVNAPTDSWCYFGDGMVAQLVDSKSYIKHKTGIKTWKFILVPSALIQQEYDLFEEQDPATGMIVKEYPHTSVITLYQSPTRTRVLVTCAFDGSETPLSRRTHELEEALLDTERLLRGAMAAKQRLHQELEQEREQHRMATQQMVNQIKEVRKASGRADDEEGGTTYAPSDQGEGGY